MMMFLPLIISDLDCDDDDDERWGCHPLVSLSLVLNSTRMELEDRFVVIIQ